MCICEPHPAVNRYQDQRQLLEWVLRNILLSRTGGQGGVAAALSMVNEVGRTLYFVRNPANRNIGGGLCVSERAQSIGECISSVQKACCS